MRKLNIVLIALWSLIFSSTQAHTYVFLNSKKDTTIVNYRVRNDTAFFSTAICFKDMFKKHHAQRYDFYIVKKLKNRQPVFLYFDSSNAITRGGQLARNPTYFKLDHKKYKSGDANIQANTDYQKLVELQNAFIDYGTEATSCITAYILKKSYNNGESVGIWYNPDFGPLKLQIYSNDEEVGRLTDNTFRLFSVDGQHAKNYIQGYCNRK